MQTPTFDTKLIKKFPTEFKELKYLSVKRKPSLKVIFNDLISNFQIWITGKLKLNHLSGFEN